MCIIVISVILVVVISISTSTSIIVNSHIMFSIIVVLMIAFIMVDEVPHLAAPDVRSLVRPSIFACKNDHQINYNCFNEPSAVSPYKSLYRDMHGLIFHKLLTSKGGYGGPKEGGLSIGQHEGLNM